MHPYVNEGDIIHACIQDIGITEKTRANFDSKEGKREKR